MAAAAALAYLQSSPQGFTTAEAQQRLDRSGPNRLPEKPPRSAWLKFIDHFKNLLVLVLIGAAILAGAIGDIKDAVVILVVVVVNASLGFYQEHRAEATLAALKHMLARHARVRRGNEVLQVDAQALVPGDIVLLEAGDRVPADARVLAAHNADVAEAALTSESHAVGKHAGLLAPGEHPLAERLNMVFMNAVVTRGRLEAVVCATGMQTEMGRISGLLEEAPEQPTPLQIQIDALGKSLVGLVGLIDPPRPEARDAIALCKQAGIQVKMITGDHALAAGAIARELGLHGAVLTGAELGRIDAAELSRDIEETAVFARVAPEHKVKIVQALKARGHVVAMTGDGVNDAPALKYADIGIAMGITGTEVTKEAAAMVLADDNFASIVGAVKEGRTIYDNIVKFVRFQLSTSVGAILTVFCAQLLSLPMPFTAIHILWIALIMDGPPAVMLGLEPLRPGIMNEPPRRSDARILTLPRLGRLLAYGSTMAVGTLGVYFHGLQSGEQVYASTLAFTTFVLFQFFNVMNARSDVGTAFNRQLFDNRKLWLALAAVLALQVVVVNWGPAQAVFDTV